MLSPGHGTPAKPSEVFPYKPPRFIREDSKRARLEADALAAMADAGMGRKDVRYVHALEDEPVDQAQLDDEVKGSPDGTIFWVRSSSCRQCSGKKPRRRRDKKTGKLIEPKSKPHAPGKCRKRERERVTRMGEDVFTCSHKGWKNAQQCVHIRKAKKKLGILSGPYSTARRRKPTIWIFSSGFKEATRRSNAYKEMPRRVPQLAYEFCRRFVTPPRSAGRTGIPLAAVCFALLMKVFINRDYDGMVHTLAHDETVSKFWRLLAPNFADELPETGTFSKRFGNENLTPYMYDIIPAQGKMGRKIDYMNLIDSDQHPKIPTMNSCTLKFGGPPPAWRKVAEMVKRHFGIGNVSNLIVALDVTLDTGIGSSDGCHLPSMARQMLEAQGRPFPSAADQAYSGKRNFRELQKMGFEALYIPEKANEQRLTARNEWCELAKKMAAFEKDREHEYKSNQRNRSKAENYPSRSKHYYPMGRLRARKGDPKPDYPKDLKLTDDGKLDEQSVSAPRGRHRTHHQGRGSRSRRRPFERNARGRHR